MTLPEPARLTSEKSRVARNRRARPTLATADLRDTILRRLGLGEGVTYDPSAIALLDQFETALRADWERIEAVAARDAARAAIATALNIPDQWRLM